MLKVEQYERIRRQVKVEGKAIREVARELGHSRKTVRKALALSEPPGYRRTAPIKRPVVGAVEGIIDRWLEEDRKRPRKQRRTATRIWELLRKDYGFPGAVRSVRRYVKWRKRITSETYFPLSFGPGEEGQVDWGEAWVRISGVETKVYLFCMRLAMSGASFVRAYRDMKTENFLDGHVRAFGFFGGVPRRLAYDNLRSAVILVGPGQERKLTKDFLRLRSHYLFESRFCNVESGNEKGHVENLVKYAQQHFFSPVPDVAAWEDVNEHLARCCEEDLGRKATRTEETRGALLAKERAEMLPLPKTEFEACARISTLADKLSLVRFRGIDYSVPVAYAHRSCVVKGFAERVEVWCGQDLVATHARNHEDEEPVLDWLHYIPLLERKPGGLANARAFKGEPWGKDLERMHVELRYRYGGEGTKKFIRVLLLFAKHPEDAVKKAVRECVECSAFSDEAVENLLSWRPVRSVARLDMSAWPELAAIERAPRPLSVYDELRTVGRKAVNA